MKGYLDFITENNNRPRMKLVLSRTLVDVLGRIEHEIAKALLELNDSDKRLFPISFIDVSDNPEMFSFSPSGRILNTFFQRFSDIEEDRVMKILNGTKLSHAIQPRDDLWTTGRQNMRVGRLIKRIFRQEFPENANVSGDREIPNDIESFVNMYRAEMLNNELSDMFLVEGGDIAKWYNTKDPGVGTLGNSCMAHSPDSYFQIYVDNPDKVKMLVYTKDGLLLGRALIWKLDVVDDREVGDRYFMDRVYVSNYADEQLFKNYARENGWLYKRFQTYGLNQPIISTGKRGQKLTMSVYLKPKRYQHYPYMDTLQLYNTDTGELTNNMREFTKDSYYTDFGNHASPEKVLWLVSTDGDPTDEVFDMVYSEKLDKNIFWVDAIWSEEDKSWIER